MSSEQRASVFIYGRPVRPDEFFNRQHSLRRVFDRVRNAESTAIVGEPHIGKSSLLLKLADPDTQEEYLGADARRMTFTIIDLHPISSDYAPDLFWNEALEDLTLAPSDETLRSLLNFAKECNYQRRSLERLFNHLGKVRRPLVLLLDEFEQLLRHPSFQETNFFPMLRSLSTRTGGLVIIPASRLSVEKMNKLAHSDTGSPYFNNLIDVKLLPFDEETVALLLAQAGDALLPVDAEVIDQVAGRHPFLTQAIAAALAAEPPGPNRYPLAFQRFYDEVSFHFEDLWHFLDDRTRAAAVIVSLLGLGSQALGPDFADRQLGPFAELGPELRRLARVGLAQPLQMDEPADWHYPIFWQGERWTIGAYAFARWVSEVIVSGLRVIPSFEAWLVQESYRALLTPNQWEWLVSTVRQSTTDQARPGIGKPDSSYWSQVLGGYFNLSELRDLCLDMDIDSENFPGTKEGFVRELILYCDRHGQMKALQQAIIRARPNFVTAP